jgi:hypothetical protein
MKCSSASITCRKQARIAFAFKDGQLREYSNLLTKHKVIQREDCKVKYLPNNCLTGHGTPK